MASETASFPGFSGRQIDGPLAGTRRGDRDMLWRLRSVKAVTDTVQVEQGPCVFCGTMTTYGAHTTRTHRYGQPNPDGSVPLIPMPPVWMCDRDLKRYIRNEVQFGWCNTCEEWGTAGQSSLCGQVYIRWR